MNKKVLNLIFVLAMIFILYRVVVSIPKIPPMGDTMQITPSSVSSTETVTVTQEIEPIGDAPQKQEQVKVEKDQTALEVLQRSHQIETKGKGINAFITSIDGRKADDAKNEFWAFYVNGKQAEVGAGSYVLKPNDKILWKIETY